MPSTFADFWRMVSEQNVELVIVLELPDVQDMVNLFLQFN
jgi:hypothetical protein